MACSKQPGPRLYISFIENVFNEKVTQSDWHALRQAAEADSGVKLTRARASRDEVEAVNAELLAAFGDRVGSGVFDDASTREFEELSAELAEKSPNVVNTRGTLAVLRYLAENGVAETLSSVRGDSEVIYDPQGDEINCVCGNTASADGFYPYAGGREVEPDEAWDGKTMFCASCRRVYDQSTGVVSSRPDAILTLEGVEISDSSDGYADRVRDLEDKFGMSTSDAQATEEAAEFMVGRRVRLKRSSDPHTELRPGDEGTIRMVDSSGTIHVQWDSGSSLGLIPGEDSFSFI